MVRDLRRELRVAHRSLEDQDLRLEGLLRGVEAYNAEKVPKYRAKAGKGQPVTAVALWGDWHWGQVVEPDQVSSQNKYSSAVARERLVRWRDGFLGWVEAQRSAYPVDELVVVGLGDMVNGLIHQEDLIYAEMEPLDAVVDVASVQASMLASLAPHFKQTRASLLSTDNHGRLTPKTMFTGRGKWCLGYIVNELVKAHTREIEGLRVDNLTTIRAQAEIAGKTFAFTHGNDVMAWMGVPWYGIKRMADKDQSNAIRSSGRGYDYWMCGHWHVHGWLDNLITNGALCGTTPYDHAHGRYSRPSQTGFLVHPVHGIFGYTPFDLGD